MKRIAFVAAALLAVACSKKKDVAPATAPAPATVQAMPPGELAANAPEANAPAPTAARSGAAPASATAVAGQEMPITTASLPARAAFERGREQMENAHAEEARVALRAAVRADPKFAQAMGYLAVLTRGPKGLAYAKGAEALAAGLPQAERLLVQHLAARKRGEGEKAGKLLEEIAALLPGDWRWQQHLALRAFNTRAWVEAEAGLRRALALNPTAAEPYNQLGYALAFQRKFDEALASVQKYAELKPKEANAQDSLAEISLLAGRFAEAAAAFAKAGTLAPRSWVAWEGAGIARALLGQWQEAHAAFGRAKESAKAPRDKLWLDIEHARAYVAAGRTGDAMRTLTAMEKAAEAQKEDVRFASAPMHRAVAMEAAGKHAEAIAYVDVALSRAEQKKLPANHVRDLTLRGHALRAWCLAALGRAADAAKSAAVCEGVAQKPENKGNPFLQASALAARGAALLAKGDPGGAVTLLKTCEPEHPFCALVRVAALRKAGDAAGADADVKAYLERPARDMTHVLTRVRLAATPAPAK